MRQALLLADEAAAEGEVPVGAVIVRGSEIIATGRNRRESERNALCHAEIEAIDNACRALGGWRLIGCTLVVTLEPCPMCTGAIINSRIEKVVYGAADPKAGSCGSVVNLFDLPYNHRPEVIGGVLADQCANRLSSFFKQLRQK
ncbi:MAG: tRNA adenosine(34) deaminase TadA [Firmicutes bacterium]|nr:tRNA adenosine(34) deaminase TadA [Bacillota bacterium]